MKINPKYKVRDIAGEKMIILQGTYGADMTKIISLNSSAELLWDNLTGREFEVEDAAKILTDNYEVSPEVAHKDAEAWIATLTEYGIITR
ncbi:MAG: PqqD family protein [Rikenellaceae bacterium]|nr:PqqD family protein [Rikenellaceae bacterium]